MDLRGVVKKFIPKKLFRAIEPYGHLGEAVLFQTLYGYPAKNMKVIGVTGTSGKTSTCFLIHRMLHEAGYKVGLMSTVAYGVGNDIRPQLHMTTVPVPELVRRLKWMKQKGVEWVVLETTSHSLAQNRVWGIPYSVAVMTNVTHEHLDYHGTFERYLAAKVKLFTLADHNTKGLRSGIINADDPNSATFDKSIKNTLLYGTRQGDLIAENIKTTPKGSGYTVHYKGKDLHITCHLPGSFNVQNSLAAVGVGIVLGLTGEQIEKGIAALTRVEGRMDRVNEGQNFDVIVDFAHTPDSFEKLFKDIKPVVKGKLIAMFGSPGRRDVTKRAIQGKLAGEYADEVIVTEDDERDVDGMEIMNMIAGGAEAAGKVRDKDLFLVHDRTEAINFAIKRARAGDMVLLLSKGHEKIILRADGEHPWDEMATARAALKKLKH